MSQSGNSSHIAEPEGHSMCLHFEPSHEKATQALNYLARENGGEINRMKALKLVYLADRYHLRTFGRPVVGDDYCG